MLKLIRFLNHVYAVTHGYWWRPCPVCYKPFGAHEMVWEESDDTRKQKSLSETFGLLLIPKKIICPLCSAKLEISLKPDALKRCLSVQWKGN